jgi:hypothetical protein
MTLTEFLTQNYAAFDGLTLVQIDDNIPTTIKWSEELFEIAEILHNLKTNRSILG